MLWNMELEEIEWKS